MKEARSHLDQNQHLAAASNNAPPSLAPSEAYSIPAGDILISRIPTVHRPP